MKQVAIILLLFSTCAAWSNPTRISAIENASIHAEEVLTNLYNATGNFLYFKPKLKIQDTKNKVAAYLPGSRTIILELTTYEICQAMGKDSLHALAFIIGHELAHSYQADVHKMGDGTNFLSYSDHIHTSVREEKTADIQGAFMAYLAGYRTNRIIATVIRSIYEEYDLVRKKLSKYPSLESRLATAEEVEEKVEELIQLFESGNYLTALGQYNFAAAAYGYIDKYYQGQEIFNNRGVNLLLHAMNFTDKNVDFYLYPLEIETETRLAKPLARGGLNDLTPTEMAYRLDVVNQAIEQFEIAKKLNFGCYSCDINLMCAYNLRGDYYKTISYFTANGLDRRANLLQLSKEEEQKAQLALAIAYISIEDKNNREKGVTILNNLADASSPLIATMAQYNLSALANPDYKKTVQALKTCATPFNTSAIKDGVLVHRYSPGSNTILLDEKTGIVWSQKQYRNSSVSNFTNDESQSITIQIIPMGSNKQLYLKNQKEPDIISTSKGFFQICEEDNTVFMANPEGKILEWAKYFKSED